MLPSYTPRKTPLQLRAEAEQERRRRARERTSAAPDAPRFRGAALRAQSITDRAWILSGPYDTGKTWAALWRLDSEARKHKSSQWTLLRKVRADMDGTVLATWKKLIVIRGGVEVFGGERPEWYDYPNGARVWVGGLDRPGKALSGERDGIYVNQAEELDEADFETLTTRASGRGAVTPTPMVWGDCNPGPEDHWIIRRRDAGALTLLESRHEDNPDLFGDVGHITEEGRLRIGTLDRLTGVLYLRGRLGLWVGAEGAYFTQLDERLHMCDLRRVPAGWQVWGAMDYGFAHPLSFGIFTLSPDGGLFLVACHHQARWYIPQHHDAMIALCVDVGADWRSLVIHCGHDMWAQRGGDDPETPADKFERRGWRLERAIIARRIGAQAIAERLGNVDAGVVPTLQFGPLARSVFPTLARMVPDPHDAEDVKKVDADANGRGGDDDYDMCRYGVMVAPLDCELPIVGGQRPLTANYRPR